MSIPITSLLHLWAKSPDPATDRPYHPLLCHLIDVAMVARALWHEALTPALRAHLADGLGLPVEAAGRWVAFLAGAHDIGKASPGFQNKWDGCRAPLAAIGLHWPPIPEDRGHGLVTALALADALGSRWGCAPRLARDLALASGGHHGIIPEWADVCAVDVRAISGDATWKAARGALIDLLVDVLDLAEQTAPVQCATPQGLALSGIISVADWIGSAERFFPPANPATITDLREYAADREARAHAALEALGWLGWTRPSAPATFAALFPTIPAPRPVQERVCALATAGGQGIAVIEVPMGEGKTEAALYLADYWGATLGQRGCYVAMPTMATSNQMFSRVREFLAARYPSGTVNLQLLHQQAAMAPELQAANADTAGPAIQPREEEEQRTQNIIAAEWFTQRKRGLLAPFGVGTVDQSLLAALRVRHGFVRLFGLAGKTVIFDEVHAYDVYMSTLHERLLTWLGAQGASVIVLTATLPIARRDAIIAAWARGAGLSPSQPPAVPYPRITWMAADGPAADTVATSSVAKRTLRLAFLAGDIAADPPEAGEIGRLLEERLAHGGCAVVICNTVRRAQAVYQALRPHFPGRANDGEPELTLFHARYPFEERDAREKQALVRFGKPGGEVEVEPGRRVPVRRPDRAILVATQVVEQSLDLDFDLMISDLAPVDLLLQRSGRLHRHPRERPPSLTTPTLHVCRPAVDAAGLPSFDRGDEAVYDAYPLLRAWLALRERVAIHIPDDIGDLIETAYAEEPPSTGDAALDQRLRTAWDEHQAERASQQRTAKTKAIPDPLADAQLWEFSRDALAEDAPELHAAFQALTRYGPPSVSIVCLYHTPAGTAFDPDGRRPAALDPNPPIEAAKALLRRSVTISHRGVWHALVDPSVETPWHASSLLRRHRLVLFDPSGEATQSYAGYRLRLDPDLGLLIEDMRKEEV